MTGNDAPTPPPITAEDRTTLRTRVQARLKAIGLSQRKVEERLVLSTGVLSKLWSGDMHLTVDLLRRLAELCTCDPLDLIRGTAFEQLVELGVESPESAALRVVEAKLDAANVANATLQGEVASLRALVAASRAAEERAEEEARAAATREAAAVDALRRKDAEAKAAATASAQAQAEARENRGRAERAEARLAGLEAALAEQTRQTTAWRVKAGELETLARTTDTQLNAVNAAYWQMATRANNEAAARAQLTAQNQQLTQQLSGTVTGGAALGGTALAFLVGLAIAGSNNDG